MVRVIAVFAVLLTSACASTPPPPWMKSGGPVEPACGQEGTPSKPSLEELRRLQRGRLLDDPDNDAEKLALAMLELACGDAREADRVLAGMKTSPLLRRYLVACLAQQSGDSAKVLAQLDQLVRENRDGRAFTLERVAVVKSASGFRRYEPCASEFKPGDVVTVYVEPRHFVLRGSGDQEVMHLTYGWSLVDDRDREIKVPAWTAAAPQDREDRVAFRGGVTEFYQFFRLRLPSNLAAGSYRIFVQVKDEIGGGEDKKAVAMSVVGTNP